MIQTHIGEKYIYLHFETVQVGIRLSRPPYVRGTFLEITYGRNQYVDSNIPAGPGTTRYGSKVMAFVRRASRSRKIGLPQGLFPSGRQRPGQILERPENPKIDSRF